MNFPPAGTSKQVAGLRQFEVRSLSRQRLPQTPPAPTHTKAGGVLGIRLYGGRTWPLVALSFQDGDVSLITTTIPRK